MNVIVYQMRKDGIEIKKELLGDGPQHIGTLLVTADTIACGRSAKVAQLQRDSGEVLLELFDVQVEAIKGPRMVLKGIEHKQTSRGTAEYVQYWLCIQAGAPLLMSSRERFFKESGGTTH